MGEFFFLKVLSGLANVLAIVYFLALLRLNLGSHRDMEKHTPGSRVSIHPHTLSKIEGAAQGLMALFQRY